MHWRDDGDGPRLARPVLDVLLDMAHCQSAELTVAAVDSALRLGYVTASAWRQAIARLPRKLRRILRSVDARAESITESLGRVRLNALGIEPRLQVRIAGVGRVDMVIGDCLVIEFDGREFHDDEVHFEIDRVRDAKLSALNYRVLRFSYKQVIENWPQVRAAVLAAVARGDHLA